MLGRRMKMAKTKFKLMKGETVGLDQPVFETQYQHDHYTDCFKCKLKVNTKVMYIDDDGSQRHMKCLSPERLKECL
jgi:hypothetical protein